MKLNRILLQANFSNPIPPIHLPLDLAYRMHQKKSLDTVSPKINPVIILHGLLGSKRNWATLSDIIANEYNTPVYAVDLRNHGESPHSSIHTLGAMSEDIRHFTQAHNLPSVTLIGHSMGAKAAMLFSLQYPNLVSRLIIVDASPLRLQPKTEIDWIEKYMTGLEKVIETKVTSNQHAEQVLIPYAPNIAIRKFLLTNLRRENNPPAFYLRSNLPVLKNYLRKAISEFPIESGDTEYDGPTLLIKGTKSKFVDPSTYKEIEKYFPNVAISEIDAGHWVQAEKPSDFLEAIEKWVAQT